MATRRLLRLPAVLEKTGLRRSVLYALMTPGEFPRPLRIGARAVAWLEDEVDEWIRKRPRGGSERPER
ncbi:MAG: AlpA family transcriptional regulator [Acidobacteria bacterium]|nr:AlpA family transcriptional regulator [Acidobacteriota bacterium]